MKMLFRFRREQEIEPKRGDPNSYLDYVRMTYDVGGLEMCGTVKAMRRYPDARGQLLSECKKNLGGNTTPSWLRCMRMNSHTLNFGWYR